MLHRRVKRQGAFGGRMSIVGHIGRPHEFTGRRLTAEDFAHEARCLRDGARRHDRLLHGRVAASGLEVSRRPCEVPVGTDTSIDCAGNEIVAPSAICVGIAGEARTQVEALPCKETEVLPVPTPSNATLVSSIRKAAGLVLLEVDPSQGCRRMGPGTCGGGDAHPIGLAVLTAVRQEWSLQRARGTCSHARTGAR